ncbi:uncharacterized protein [Malus domestica]|uniref:uncharacterized protein isoform X2 n=1 Tax=Malus domestica TaxID=3750 RepID=UPI003975385F
MASALLSLPFNLPPSSSPLSAVPNSPKPKSHIRLFTSSRRRARVTASAADQEKTKDTEKDSDSDSAAFNPFGFVTDNPSSRSAIQISESPAESGNVGQMLYRIEDKGKEYGKYFRAGEYVWFVRETGSAESERGTVVFLHGAPTQSYSYRNVMSQLSEDFGFHCLAPDWLGFGFSDKPQAGYDDFDYKEEEFHKEFDKLLDKLRVKSPFYLVVQGFLVGSYGLTWALKNPSKISKLAILNTPLTVSSPVPGLFKQLRFPFLGEFTCQNAVMAERFIEAGSAWDTPTLVVWGISDKYLPQFTAEEFQKANPTAVQLKLIEGAGHMPQEDWPERVVTALRVFF